MHDRLVQALFLSGVGAFLFSMLVSTTPVERASFSAQTIDSTLDTSITNTTDLTTTTDTSTALTTTTTDTSTTDQIVLSDGVITTTDLTTDTTVVDERVTTVASQLPVCPFKPDTARTVIDFTHGGTLTYSDLVIIANGTELQATRKITATVAPGVYDIRLASFDAHITTTRPEYREIWALGYEDDAGVRRRTPVIRDIRDTETLVIETVEKGVTITNPVVRMLAQHGAFPGDLQQTVVPLCAVFDRVGDVSVPVPSTVPVPEVLPSVPIAETVAEIYPRCPFPERDGRKIFDFTKGGTIPLRRLVVRADATEDASNKGPFPVSIPQGTYTVRLASYGGKFEGVGYPDQVWQLALYDALGTRVARTPASRDVPDWNTDFASLVSESFVVTTPAVSLRALHAAYPSEKAGPIGIVCAAFDRIDGARVVPSVPETASSVPPTVRQVIATTSILTASTSNVNEVNTAPMVDTRHSVSPQEVGIEGALRSVRVRDQSVIDRRKAVAETVGGAILPVLSAASRVDREVLVAKLVESAASTTEATSTAPVRTFVLQRTSREDAAPVGSELPSSGVEGESGARNLNEMFTERTGVVATRDTDGDGVTDYDEQTLYGTDPEEPFTAGGVLTDGERILLGLNPHATDTTPVMTESPRSAGQVNDGFLVTSLERVASTGKAVFGDTVQIRVRGMAPPHSFVTLYVYSTPIILTVRTDGAGRFDYVFDETLEDGEHALYVTSVNDAGKILAKSEPLPFVKTAEAVTVTPTSVTSDPAQKDLHASLTIAFLLMLLAALTTIIGIGIHKAQQHGCSITDSHGNSSS